MAVKGSIGGVGAPTPLFDSYPSSCGHLFMENTSKLHFLYHTNLVGYEYVDKNLEKIPPIFLDKDKTHFLALELRCHLNGL